VIFWILLGAAVVAVIWTFIWNLLEDGIALAFLGALLAAMLSGLVGGGLFALSVALIPGEKVTSETHDLRAISTSSTIQGRFFLGSGYVDGKRTLNYIAQEDGYSRLGQATASAAYIWEDTDKPTVTEYTWWYSNGWVTPGNLRTGYSWDFHIPAGSILEDYGITND